VRAYSPVAGKSHGTIKGSGKSGRVTTMIAVSPSMALCGHSDGRMSHVALVGSKRIHTAIASTHRSPVSVIAPGRGRLWVLHEDGAVFGYCDPRGGSAAPPGVGSDGVPFSDVELFCGEHMAGSGGPPVMEGPRHLPAAPTSLLALPDLGLIVCPSIQAINLFIHMTADPIPAAISSVRGGPIVISERRIFLFVCLFFFLLILNTYANLPPPHPPFFLPMY
jgi:hypothetical protein